MSGLGSSRVSVIIPSRGEPGGPRELFMPNTAYDLLGKAAGDVEVIVVLDGYWPDPPLEDRPNLKVVHFGAAKGMRACTNAGAAVATGKYLMKVDAHCMFAPGYDETLKADCADNWIVIPRRYSLDAEKWEINPTRECIDYEHIFYPYEHPDDLGLHARPWMQRSRERKHIEIDEDMSFQGSCWFMTARHFHKHLGGLSEAGYGIFWGEPQEVGFKTQLGPWEGAIMRNKKTWYAHLHKGKQWGRMYHISRRERTVGNAWYFDYWWNNRWEQRKHDIEWLIERFMPIPGWPENWKELHFAK